MLSAQPLCSSDRAAAVALCPTSQFALAIAPPPAAASTLLQSRCRRRAVHRRHASEGKK